VFDGSGRVVFSLLAVEAGDMKLVASAALSGQAGCLLAPVMLWLIATLVSWLLRGAW